METEKTKTPIEKALEFTELEVKFNFENLNYEDFEFYEPVEYKMSENYKMDRIYNIRQSVMIHKASGIGFRIKEKGISFSDEETGEVFEMFIKTINGKILKVLDTDCLKLSVITKSGEIDFRDLSKDQNAYEEYIELSRPLMEATFQKMEESIRSNKEKRKESRFKFFKKFFSYFKINSNKSLDSFVFAI